MYAFYLAFDWLANHYIWTTLGILVFGGTLLIALTVDRDR